MAIYSFLNLNSDSTLDFAVRTMPALLIYDFATTGSTPGIFAASPTTQLSPVTAGTGIFAHGYFAYLATTPVNVFPDNDYLVTFHDRGAAGNMVGAAVVTMRAGNVVTNTTLSSADIAAIAAAIGAGHACQAGSTATIVALTVPSNTVVADWVGGKLRHLATSSQAAITGTPTLVGTTATVHLGTGLPTPTAGDFFLPILP